MRLREGSKVQPYDEGGEIFISGNEVGGGVSDFCLGKFCLLLPLGVLLGGWVWAEFVVPDAGERAGAVGDLSGLNPSVREAFVAGDDFLAKRKPDAGDWLASHEEAGQSYGDFLRAKANKPNGRRKVIYFQPLGEFDEEAPNLKVLQGYMEAYFMPLEVKFLKPRLMVDQRVRKRMNGVRQQFNSKDLLGWSYEILPKDAYAMLMVTMTDLYPGEGWNFVFGQASTKNRVGVFSFARYVPSFGGAREEGWEGLVLERAAKVMTHEMGHMFGIKHCVFYECNMNGVNHKAEMDAAPMNLCPVCLRKLYEACKFDPVKRYRELGVFYGKQGFGEEKEFVEKRVGRILE